MRRMRRSQFSRYFVIVFVLLFNFACESEEGCASCDTMMTPLSEPMAEEDKTYDAVQLRIAERTFLYIEEHFPQIVQMVLPDGGIWVQLCYLDESEPDGLRRDLPRRLH